MLTETTRPPDQAAHLAAKIERAKSNALDALNKLLLHLTADLDDRATRPWREPGLTSDRAQAAHVEVATHNASPPSAQTAPSTHGDPAHGNEDIEEDDDNLDNTDELNPAAQARTATQRMRLCFQVARELLRLAPLQDPPDTDDTRPNRARQEADRPAHPRTTPSSITTNSRTGSPDATSETATPASTETPPTTPAAQASPFLAAAGPGRSRFGDGLSPSLAADDSQLSTEHSAPPDASPSTRHSASPTSPHSLPKSAIRNPQPAIPPPPPFTAEEKQQIAAILGPEEPFPEPLFERLLVWSEYADATNTRHPLNIEMADLLRRNPHRRAPPRFQ